MKANAERHMFCERLQQALRSGNYSSDSATQLAREFNMRFSGAPITPHAARKWLSGESIPTQEKLRTLADWLEVPTEWLRFGDSHHLCITDVDAGITSRIQANNVNIMHDLQSLDEKQQLLVYELIRLLLHILRSGSSAA